MPVLLKTAASAPIGYSDRFVARLYAEIGALIEGDALDADGIAHDLEELAARNNPSVREYWRRTRPGLGVPESAFRGRSLFHFPDAAPVCAFRTSGTTARARGVAEYSERGLDLMHRSIVVNARRHVFGWLDRPTVIRLVPDPHAARGELMPHVAALLARTFGDPASSTSIAGGQGLDVPALIERLNRAVVEERPVVMIGGSSALAHLCDALGAAGRRWVLPYRSRIVDAGGLKGRSRALEVDALRGRLAAILGLGRECFNDIFGTAGLASQLYDGVNAPLGPKGERPKHALAFLRPRIRNPITWASTETGPGLLDVADLCVLDRPYAVLTGDWGIASQHGVVITGRAVAAESRGGVPSFASPAALRVRHAERVAHAAA
jgi:hypothetical protein